MAAKRKLRRAPDRRYILVIDVGGTHVKARIGPHGAIHEFESGAKMTPARMTLQARCVADFSAVPPYRGSSWRKPPSYNIQKRIRHTGAHIPLTRARRRNAAWPARRV